MIKTFKGNTCVHLALLNGHEQTAHLLLQHFPQFINEKGEQDRTPVHIACIYDYFRCLSLLIGVGADLSMKDSNGETPLHICMEYSSAECLKLLLQDNSNIDIFDDSIDNYNWKPMDVAQTFEFGRLFNRLLKERKLEIASGGNNLANKRPSFQIFRTPLLDNKSAFEDGPSPVLSLNPSMHVDKPSNSNNKTAINRNSFTSPNGTNISAINFSNVNNNNNTSSVTNTASDIFNTSYSFASPFSKLPPISNSRKASFSTISNSNLIASRNSSKANKSSPMKNSVDSDSTQLLISQDTLPLRNDNHNINNYLSGLDTPTSKNSTQTHSDNNIPKDQIFQDEKSSISPRKRPTMANTVPGKRVSLLNIPITRIRNDSITPDDQTSLRKNKT